jgi:hypothetical protein
MYYATISLFQTLLLVIGDWVVEAKKQGVCVHWLGV